MAIEKGEWHKDLIIHLKDGEEISIPGVGHSLPKLTVGLTDSPRWLCFVVPTGKEDASFVLHMEQVEHLHKFLSYALPHMTPIGPPRAARRAAG